MYQTILEVVGLISGVVGIAGFAVAVRKHWRSKKIVEWFRLPTPPVVPQKFPGRMQHPQPVNHDAANKVFLVGSNAISDRRVRFLAKLNRSGGQSCYIYDLQSGARVLDIDNAGGANAWNDFFENIGHPVPYAAIPYTDDSSWVDYGRQQVAVMRAELEH